MNTVTVRRWVDAPPERVWLHLLDLPRLVVDDRALDLEDVVGDVRPGMVPPCGTHATITRRDGVRVERLVLEVVDRVESQHVTVTVRIGSQRWLVSVTLAAMDGDGGCGTDVRFHAELDPCSIRGRGPRSLVAGQRGAHRVGELLHGFARQVDVAAEAGGSPRDPVPTQPQRIAAGR